MISWGKQIIELLQKISEQLERIEANQQAIMRSNKSGRKFIAAGPPNA